MALNGTVIIENVWQNFSEFRKEFTFPFRRGGGVNKTIMIFMDRLKAGGKAENFEARILLICVNRTIFSVKCYESDTEL
jgi:hypothetical protein